MSNLDIKQIRRNLHLSQAEFALKIGVHPKTIQNWEAGKVIPDSKMTILRELQKESQTNVHQENINGDNVHGDGVTINKTNTDLLQKYAEQLERKDQQIDQKNQQINRLLSIIERMQNSWPRASPPPKHQDKKFFEFIWCLI